MSLSISSVREPTYQPFQCSVCLSRFTRRENLRRHAALHSRSQKKASLPCDFCQATFSRADLRHRHMKRKHPEREQRRPAKKRREIVEWTSLEDKVQSVSPPESQDDVCSQHSGDEAELEVDSRPGQTTFNFGPQLDQDHYPGQANPVANAPVRTERNKIQAPSIGDLTAIDRIVQDATDLERSLLLETSLFNPSQLSEAGLPMTTTSQPAPYDTNLDGFNFSEYTGDGLLLSTLTPPQDDWYPSETQISRGCHLFFSHISPFLPILHEPTFDATQAAPHLLISILSLAYQYGEDPDYDEPGSGAILSTRCFHHAQALLGSSEGNTNVVSCSLPTVQSYLLLQICAMMFLCGDESANGLKMHSTMISLARAGGMMQPLPSESIVTENLESLWRVFIKTESHKRTLFAVHQIDALWYQFLSIPRSISHLEIKHDLPCPEAHWSASSAAEWAHRRLLARNSGDPSVQYADAVRRFLSPSPDANLNSIPAFDPYGAINIAQFLISSAREISGWSTMTGMLSMERFAALRSSLLALSPFIRSQPEQSTATATPTTACEATWQTAMIELQMWSPSHTGGIVEGSINAVLNQSTSLAAPSPTYDCFLSDSSTAKAIQVHVNWFLHYLDATVNPDTEAPWIALYAYKAFLIVWQLVRAGVPGAMQVVGVYDGDAEGALQWARGVFQRRQRWQIGKLILSCLDELGKQGVH